MKNVVCDCCGNRVNIKDCYDEDGYSQFVNIEVRDSRKHSGEYDLCNTCYEMIKEFADRMRESKQ